MDNKNNEEKKNIGLCENKIKSTKLKPILNPPYANNTRFSYSKS